MSMSKMASPKLSYANSVLQATGNGGVGKRRVAKVLNETYQHDPYGKFVIRLKYHIPNEVRDEIEKDKGVLGEALTKLVNKAKDGPLKAYKDDHERLLQHAIKFFSTKEGGDWMREQFVPQPTDASSWFSNNAVNNESIVAVAPGPVEPTVRVDLTNTQTRRLDDDVVSTNDSTPSLPAANIRTPGLEMMGVSPVPQTMVSAVAPQISSPATPHMPHRRVRSDPGPNGFGLNVLCPHCGRAHLFQPKNNGTLLGNPMNTKTTSMMILVVLAIVYAVLGKGYPKV